MLSPIIALVMIPILFVTYKVKKLWLLWPLIVLPPLLIAPLALVPIRDPIILGMVWIPVFPFFLGSIIVLIKRIVAIIKNSPEKLIKIKLIRPILTILMFTSVFAYHRVSKNMANQYAISLAKDIQAICDGNDLCPVSIPDWEQKDGVFGDPNYYSSTIHKLRIAYPVRYRPSPDRKSFTVSVIHGFNMGTYVEGGIDEKLRAVYSDEGGEYEIPIK